MTSLHEGHRTGLGYLDTTTSLMQRARTAHPTHGLYQAAELQWWWGIPRSTDDFPQLFWFDDDGRPAAAVTMTDFSGNRGSALYDDPTIVVTVMPDAPAGWVAHVIERGLAHVAEHGIETVELEVGQTDDVQRNVLFARGFEVTGDGMVECWLDAAARPEISSLHEDYRLVRRADTTEHAHHMADDRRPEIEQRLQQTSLYRSDLDLAVLDRDDAVAGYGLFWYDPVTSTGTIEPMRTQDDHQRRGLARHILTTGVDLLAQAGAERISIGYEPDNPASGHLYRSIGFVPHQQTDLCAGPTRSHRA